MPRLLPAIGAVILAVIIAIRAWGPEPGAEIVVAEGSPATLAFVLKDMTGRDVNLEDYKGKPLVVNFWATWCGPCRVETPTLQALSEKYKEKGLTILGIETDSEADAIRKFAADYKVTYPLLIGLDRRDVQEAFNWTGSLPTTVFVKGDGTIVAHVRGLQTDEFWEKTIQSLF